jgi:hypothetical protein
MKAWMRIWSFAVHHFVSLFGAVLANPSYLLISTFHRLWNSKLWWRETAEGMAAFRPSKADQVNPVFNGKSEIWINHLENNHLTSYSAVRGDNLRITVGFRLPECMLGFLSGLHSRTGCRWIWASKYCTAIEKLKSSTSGNGYSASFL